MKKSLIKRISILTLTTLLIIPGSTSYAVGRETISSSYELKNQIDYYAEGETVKTSPSSLNSVESIEENIMQLLESASAEKLPSITATDYHDDLPEEDITPSIPSITGFTSTDQGLLIQWTPSEGADGYRIYRRNSAGTFKKLCDTEDLTVLDTKKKTDGENYSYRIRAFVRVEDKLVWSPYSEVADMIYLASPTITSLTRTAKKTVTKWEANPYCQGYEVQTAQKKSFKGARTYTIKKGTTTKKTFTKGKADRTYYIRIRAYNKKGDTVSYSNWSNVVSTIAWKASWEFAGNSKIHTGYTAWYQSPVKASKRKNLTVCVNAGHGTKGGGSVKTLSHPDGTGKVTGGTNGKGEIYSIAVSSGMDMADGTPEAKVTLALAKVVREELLSAGYDVLMIREAEDIQLDNIARTVMANQFADCHLALHYNDTSTNAGAFYCAVPNVKSYRSMYPVSKHYKEHLKLGDSLIAGLKKGGWKVKGSNMEMDLTQTSYSTIPSIDLEVGDKKTDYSKAALTKLAKGIVKGVNIYFK